MDFIDVVLFGAIVGGFANLLYPGSYKRLLGTIILGSLGAICGSVLAALVFGSASSTSLISANFLMFVGAFLIVMVSKALKRFE
jgi:uncharacterized membrane protein YeaQ/YmgE (transglycosylase-associated protein family)